MIPRRYVWLLRDDTLCFEQFTGACKLCAALGRGVGVPPLSRAAHLAAHRREKIVADEPAPLTVVGATMEDT